MHDGISMLTLYSMRRSGNCYKVRLALAHRRRKFAAVAQHQPACCVPFAALMANPSQWRRISLLWFALSRR
jgi:hypothetical protein